MSTHDADKTNKAPSDRRTMTRDPNSTGGAIVEGRDSDSDGNRKTTAGSTHLTTNIDGKWYVCNTRGEPFDGMGPYDTETEAVTEAQKFNQVSTGAAASEDEIERLDESDDGKSKKAADKK